MVVISSICAIITKREKNMRRTISFFGHRSLWEKDLRKRLKAVVESKVCDELHCLIGTHGDFDELALSVCRELRRTYPHIKISVVFTSLSIFQNVKGETYSMADDYEDVETTTYEIEEEYLKKRIIVSNKKMIDESDLVICYVNMNKCNSGARIAVNYAMKQGKEVINIF